MPQMANEIPESNGYEVGVRDKRVRTAYLLGRPDYLGVEIWNSFR